MAGFCKLVGFSPSDIKVRGIEVGIASAPKLFAMIAKEIDSDAPKAIPYGVLAGLAELSYSSRTLHQEVSEVILQLSAGDSIDDFRSAINLLWANRSRISTTELCAQAEQMIDQMARLEKSGQLFLADKALGYLMLETVVEHDKKLQHAITRRFRETAEVSAGYD